MQTPGVIAMIDLPSAAPDFPATGLFKMQRKV